MILGARVHRELIAIRDIVIRIVAHVPMEALVRVATIMPLGPTNVLRVIALPTTNVQIKAIVVFVITRVTAPQIIVMKTTVNVPMEATVRAVILLILGQTNVLRVIVEAIITVMAQGHLALNRVVVIAVIHIV